MSESPAYKTRPEEAGKFPLVLEEFSRKPRINDLLVENRPFLSKLNIPGLAFASSFLTAARVQAPIRGTSASPVLGHRAS